MADIAAHGNVHTVDQRFVENESMQNQSQKIAALLAGALLGAAALTAAAAPRIQTGPDAEVTEDGLHRVDGGTLERAWVTPGASLDAYTSVLLTLSEMQFREVKDPGMRRSATDFPLTEEQKTGLQRMIQDAFIAELRKSKRFELTDQPGPRVLEVRGAIVDVVSHVPDEPAGRGAVFMRSLGEATLVVELRDSVTQQVIARAVDHRAAERAVPVRSSSVANKSEVRFAAQQWASLLRRRLDDFSVL